MASTTMRWVHADSSDYRGTPPSPRSGHTSVKVGGSLVVVFGGLAEKTFLQDLTVLDINSRIWFNPSSAVGGSDRVGPGPRAFHVAVASHGHMFVFGGRSGRKRLGDFWVLDTEPKVGEGFDCAERLAADNWQWAELVGYGDVPPARDFAAGASFGDGKLVIYGGWDGSKWLSDVFVLDTISLEWRQLSILGPTPAPRCGHSLTIVEKRMLIFGGRGGGGPIMGDLWALKGLFDDEGEPAVWTQLKLPGSAPTPRCGHSITSGGPQLFVFGGHGTGGWLTRYDVYYNDVVMLDRASVHWKRVSVIGLPPPSRAYHSMTAVHGRHLVFGGYDGKLTHNDMWWLVSEDDPIGSRKLLMHQLKPEALSAPNDGSRGQKDHEDEKAGFGIAIFELARSKAPDSIHDLRQQLGLPAHIAAESKEKLVKALHFPTQEGQDYDCEAIREQWSKACSRVMRLQEVEFLLKDYQTIVSFLQKSRVETRNDHRFFHLRDVKEVRLDDVSLLLNEYKKLQASVERHSLEIGTCV